MQQIQLQEIEMGTSDSGQVSQWLQTMLQISPAVEQEGLTVFTSGKPGIDLNFSSHFPPGITCLSFLTNDLQYYREHFTSQGIAVTAPFESHLGMLTIEIPGPEGLIIRINMATDRSPLWLQERL